MPASLTDPNTIATVVTIIGGVLIVEEVGGFIIGRVAKEAGAGPTVTRDIKTGLRGAAGILIVSYFVSFIGLSSLFTGLTVSAVLAVAVSLALQTTLTNVISGLLLFNDGVLRLGDTIEYSGKKGKVVRVGLRNTWIRSEGGLLTVVSNSALSGGPLVNYTATDRLSKKYAFGQD